MEIKKIRIGNDIRLAVDLRQYIGYGSQNERQVVQQPISGELSTQQVTTQSTSSPVSIRSIKAILVNKSRKEEADERLRKTTRFVSRFPVEPCYMPTSYDVCGAGCPTWRAYPHRGCPSCYGLAPYHGFGVEPKWDAIYNTEPRHDTDFVANVFATKEPNVVEVDFPAAAQIHTGVYKLVIVAKLYAPGYNSSNLKTITVDVPDVFELVSDSTEAFNSDVLVNVSHVIDVFPSVTEPYEDMDQDVYAFQGEIDGDKLTIQRNDGGEFDVDMSSITNWHEIGD